MTTLSPDQEKALEAIETWFRVGGQEFRMGGLAGTGKTTIIAQLPEVLKLAAGTGIHYCAPTGKAASVLGRKLPRPHGATTIHRLMYRPSEFHCDKCPVTKNPDAVCHGMNSKKCELLHDEGNSRCTVRFSWAPPEFPPDLVVVDEASMVSGAVYDHLMEIGTKVLFVGDHGQLPPVEKGMNLMAEDALDVKLERIHRQAEGNPIIRLAMMAREGTLIRPGEYGDGVRCLPGDSLRRDGFDADVNTLLLTYTNKNRMKMNALMRQALGFPVDEPVPGDKVVCLKNNAEKGISNGTLGIIDTYRKRGVNTYDMSIRLVDEDRFYVGRVLADQFTEQDTLFIRDKGTDLWTFGYCLTTHKAQGSEAEDVVIFEEPVMRYMNPDERQRWRYTAITRAKQRLTIYTPQRSG